MKTADTTLPKLLLEKAHLFGDRVAMREKYKGIWQELSWNTYLAKVTYFALGLYDLGIQPGETGSILGENCPEWIFADLALQSLRCISVGIYPTNSPEQAWYILEHSQSRLVVVKDQEQVDKVLEVKDRLPLLRYIIAIDDKGLRHYQEKELLRYEEIEARGRIISEQNPGLFSSMIEETRPEDVAFIVYTSGTTGHPKGAMISHRNHIHGILLGMQPVLRFNERDNLLSYLPLCHILERALSMSMPLVFGYTINFAESIDTVTQNIQEISPTLFAAVPRILEKMHSNIFIKIQDTTRLKRFMFHFWLPAGRRAAHYRHEHKAMPFSVRLAYLLGYLFCFRSLRDKLGMVRTRCLMSGGAPIAPEVLDFYRCLGIYTVEMYAMTECGAISGPHETVKPGSVGEPCASLECMLAEDGEILVRGDAVFAGYWRDLDATSEIMRDGWLHTGDIGRIDEDGHLYIVDRKKDIIITSGGKNISPSEIENLIKCSPFVKEAVVIGDKKKFLSALVQIDYENVGNWAQKNKIPYTNYKSLAENKEVYTLIQEEINRANDQLARVEEIKKFSIISKELDQDEGELTATQKVKRKVIEQRFKDEIEAMYRVR
ncbi:MAG: AMP-dependent synthetase/ligase [Desulfomonilia bacterium]